MTERGNRISDDAVRAATGRTWSEWVGWLDERNAEALSHRDIVALLRDQGDIESGWWQQAVTGGYERLKGRRVAGETEGAGFQIGVRRTVPIPHERAWRVLTSDEGLRAWLGEAETIRLEEGESYRLADGSGGKVRVVRPDRHLRLTWKPPGWARASTIQVRLLPKGANTVIAFHQEHLPGAAEREARRKHFEAAVAALLDIAAAG